MELSGGTSSKAAIKAFATLLDWPAGNQTRLSSIVIIFTLLFLKLKLDFGLSQTYTFIHLNFYNFEIVKKLEIREFVSKMEFIVIFEKDKISF